MLHEHTSGFRTYFRYVWGWIPSGGARGNPDPFDIALVLGPVFLVAFVLAITRYWDTHLRTVTLTRAVHTLQEQAQTREFELDSIGEARSRAQRELYVPHPALGQRDAQFIGGHTIVNWSYSAENGPRLVSFEIELTQLKSASPGEMFQCPSTTTAEKPGAPRPPDKIERFIATDPGNRTSRVPGDPACNLSPGEYAWRVAAVPLGTSVQYGEESKRLSEWSGYAYFALYPSVIERIVTTRRLRVGASLEQDSNFARRRNDGKIEGFEISLARALTDRLKVDSKNRKLSMDRLAPATALPRDGILESELCPGHHDVCLEFVPVLQWGDWQAALRSKEIDIFIGGATKAAQRARGGIQFTQGYLRFETRLYTRASDLPRTPARAFADWLKQDRTVGVIGDSSNELLLDEIIAPQEKKGYRGFKLFKKKFPSFPQLEDAMDRGAVDAVLVDETFVDHEDWVRIGDLSAAQPEAFKAYHTKFLGANVKDEEIAIAVAVDEPDNTHAGQDSLQKLLDDGLTHLKSPTRELCQSIWLSKRASYECEVPE